MNRGPHIVMATRADDVGTVSAVLTKHDGWTGSIAIARRFRSFDEAAAKVRELEKKTDNRIVIDCGEDVPDAVFTNACSVENCWGRATSVAIQTPTPHPGTMPAWKGAKLYVVDPAPCCKRHAFHATRLATNELNVVLRRVAFRGFMRAHGKVDGEPIPIEHHSSVTFAEFPE